MCSQERVRVQSSICLKVNKLLRSNNISSTEVLLPRWTGLVLEWSLLKNPSRPVLISQLAFDWLAGLSQSDEPLASYIIPQVGWDASRWKAGERGKSRAAGVREREMMTRQWRQNPKADLQSHHHSGCWHTTANFLSFICSLSQVQPHVSFFPLFFLLSVISRSLSVSHFLVSAASSARCVSLISGKTHTCKRAWNISPLGTDASLRGQSPEALRSVERLSDTDMFYSCEAGSGGGAERGWIFSVLGNVLLQATPHTMHTPTQAGF